MRNIGLLKQIFVVTYYFDQLGFKAYHTDRGWCPGMRTTSNALSWRHRGRMEVPPAHRHHVSSNTGTSQKQQHLTETRTWSNCLRPNVCPFTECHFLNCKPININFSSTILKSTVHFPASHNLTLRQMPTCLEVHSKPPPAQLPHAAELWHFIPSVILLKARSKWTDSLKYKPLPQGENITYSKTPISSTT